MRYIVKKLMGNLTSSFDLWGWSWCSISDIRRKASFFDDSEDVPYVYVAVVTTSDEELSICRKGCAVHRVFMVE
jgi:hypothetical protein